MEISHDKCKNTPITKALIADSGIILDNLTSRVKFECHHLFGIVALGMAFLDGLFATLILNDATETIPPSRLSLA